jgi:SH3 domain protein
MKQLFILTAGLWLTGSAWAETAYVTDKLQLNMYATQDLVGNSLQKLRSGDKVEVLSRAGRVAEVKADSGQQGWVKDLYLVADEPARARINQLERSNEVLEGTVKKLRAQVTAEKDKLKQLLNVQDGSEDQQASTAAELEKLRSEKDKLESRLSAYGMNVPLSWLLTAVLIALAGGIVSCWIWIDRRSRSRHGGYRIY